MKNGTAIVQCNCKHEYQDRMYGKDARVANATAKQDEDFIEVRCTVCSRVQQVNPSRVKG